MLTKLRVGLIIAVISSVRPTLRTADSDQTLKIKRVCLHSGAKILKKRIISDSW